MERLAENSVPTVERLAENSVQLVEHWVDSSTFEIPLLSIGGSSFVRDPAVSENSVPTVERLKKNSVQLVEHWVGTSSSLFHSTRARHRVSSLELTAALTWRQLTLNFS